MKLIAPSFEIFYPEEPEWPAMLTRIERIARKCYKSEGSIGPGSAEKLVRKLLARRHEAMIEHAHNISVLFTVDRGVTHEEVRHRMASFAQESTRYCNYAQDRFGSEVTFIDTRPMIEAQLRTDNKADNIVRALEVWLDLTAHAERAYLELIELGVKPELARSILTNALKSEIVITTNVREWRWIFHLRTAKEAHPQMREVMRPLLAEFRRRVPILFDDVGTTD